MTLLVPLLILQTERRAQPVASVVPPEVLQAEWKRPLQDNEVLRRLAKGGNTPEGLGYSVLIVRKDGYVRQLSNSFKSFKKLSPGQLQSLNAAIRSWKITVLNALPRAEHAPSSYDGSDVTILWRDRGVVQKWEAFRYQYDHESSPLGQIEALKIQE